MKESVVVSGRVAPQVRSDLERLAGSKGQSSSGFVGALITRAVQRWNKNGSAGKGEAVDATGSGGPQHHDDPSTPPGSANRSKRTRANG